MIEICKFYGEKPGMRDVHYWWRHAKKVGDIPKSHSFAKWGSLRQVWGGWLLVHQ